MLAGWILPTIWALQMRTNTKLLVMSMFASRVVVCALDINRAVFIRRALDADDQTCWCPLSIAGINKLTLNAGSQLPWAILDQVIVHLSINHATLPRVHVFLSNLQTGLLVTRLATNAVNRNSKGSKRSRDADASLPLNGSGERRRRSQWNWSQKPDRSVSKGKVMKLLEPDHNEIIKEGSISESTLRLQGDQDFELVTTIYADHDTSASRGRKNDTTGGWYEEAMSNGGPITSLPIGHLSRHNSGVQLKGSSSRTSGQRITINAHTTVERTTESAEGNERPGGVAHD
jgi:hypothetical protein